MVPGGELDFFPCGSDLLSDGLSSGLAVPLAVLVDPSVGFCAMTTDPVVLVVLPLVSSSVKEDGDCGVAALPL